MYYFAYGTNINTKVFLKRYRNSKKIKKHVLKNFQLEFRTKYGVPDIKKKTGKKVIGIIYFIDKNIEKRLDKYEDYPRIYIKKYFFFKKNKVMYYSVKKKGKIVKPNNYYLKIFKEGLKINKIYNYF